MLDIAKNIVSILTSDTTLNAIVPVTSIFTGPTDIVKESQSSLGFPQINISCVSETIATVPRGARYSRFQLDIWSRNSELENQTIYERVLYLLNFVSGNKNSTHIFWERLNGASSSFESDVRVWHISHDFVIWSI